MKPTALEEVYEGDVRKRNSILEIKRAISSLSQKFSSPQDFGGSSSSSSMVYL
jgi:hypothetical protein